MNLFQKCRLAYFGLYEYHLLKIRVLKNEKFVPNVFLHLKKCFALAKKKERKGIDWYSVALGIHKSHKSLNKEVRW